MRTSEIYNSHLASSTRRASAHRLIPESVRSRLTHFIRNNLSLTPQANGSALLSLGGTEVLAVVKAEVTPQPNYFSMPVHCTNRRDHTRNLYADWPSFRACSEVWAHRLLGGATGRG